jgi:hypothetical protein
LGRDLPRSSFVPRLAASGCSSSVVEACLRGEGLTHCGHSCAHPVPEIADVVRVSLEGARSAIAAKLSLRQARLAQAVEQMLGIRGLVEGQPPLRAVDRVLRIDPQHLGRLRTSLIEPPQLREIGGQPDVA